MAKIDELKLRFWSKYNHKKLNNYHFYLVHTFGGILYCLKLSYWCLFVFICRIRSEIFKSLGETCARSVCKYILFYLICRWNEYVRRIKGIQFGWYYRANTLAISSDWNYVIFPCQNYVIYLRLLIVSVVSFSKMLC